MNERREERSGKERSGYKRRGGERRGNKADMIGEMCLIKQDKGKA